MYVQCQGYVCRVLSIGCAAQPHPVDVGTAHTPLCTHTYHPCRVAHMQVNAQRRSAGKCYTQGQWGSEIVEPMAPQDGDIVVKGMLGLCGFASANLVSNDAPTWPRLWCLRPSTTHTRPADRVSVWGCLAEKQSLFFHSLTHTHHAHMCVHHAHVRHAMHACASAT